MLSALGFSLLAWKHPDPNGLYHRKQGVSQHWAFSAGRWTFECWIFNRNWQALLLSRLMQTRALHALRVKNSAGKNTGHRDRHDSLRSLTNVLVFSLRCTTMSCSRHCMDRSFWKNSSLTPNRYSVPVVFSSCRIANMTKQQINRSKCMYPQWAEGTTSAWSKSACRSPRTSEGKVTLTLVDAALGWIELSRWNSSVEQCPED